MTRHLERPAIDEVLQAVLSAAESLSAIDSFDDVEIAREQLRLLTVPTEMLPPVHTEDRAVEGDDGTAFRVRLYWPGERRAASALPVVVFYHGGGFALGDLDLYEWLCRTLCLGTEAIVVSPEYRLAPEHPFPAAVNDAWTALQWVQSHTAEFGGDPHRIAVAGDSAGGNLAAVVAQIARDYGGPALAFQWLLYPVTTFDLSLPSFTENAEAPILNAANAATLISWYAPDVDPADPPVRLAPARAEQLAGLAEAYIGIAEWDPLRDDGARYAELLQAAGVPVELHRADTLTHGYAYFAIAVPAAHAALQHGIDRLRAGLHPGHRQHQISTENASPQPGADH